jgi:hypothetical protein
MKELVEQILTNSPDLINNTTIFYKKFPIDLIEANISKLNMANVLITQDLTIEFIYKYILLDPDVINESYANIETICYYQKGINKNDLINFCNKNDLNS